MRRQNSKSWRSKPQKGTGRDEKYKSYFVLLVVLCGLALCSPISAQQRSLKDVFRNDFMIGAALNRRQIFEEDTRGAAIVSKQFNTITPENVLKWALVHPKP